VNVSSSAGHLSRIPGEHLRNILASPDLTEEKLSSLITSFVKYVVLIHVEISSHMSRMKTKCIRSWFRAAKDGIHIQEGWPNSAYVVSKVGVSALTRIQQRELLKDENRPDIVVNHVHPGYVDTDMTSHKGHLTIEQGASLEYSSLI